MTNEQRAECRFGSKAATWLMSAMGRKRTLHTCSLPSAPDTRAHLPYLR